MGDYRERISSPPSAITGPLGIYLRELAKAINDMPSVSFFSGNTPNSAVTGYPGDLAINVGSESTDTRVWVLGGGARQPSTVGWVTIRTGPI